MFPVPRQIGGTEEYKICRGIKEGRITKPVVCWCIGTCATMFSSEVRPVHVTPGWGGEPSSEEQLAPSIRASCSLGYYKV